MCRLFRGTYSCTQGSNWCVYYSGAWLDHGNIVYKVRNCSSCNVTGKVASVWYGNDIIKKKIFFLVCYVIFGEDHQ